MEHLLTSTSWFWKMKNVRIRSYSVQMRENTDQNNTKYGHLLCSAHSENQGWINKYAQNQQYKHRKKSMASFWCFFN